MAFPTTGIVDNFDRANAINLGTNWTALAGAGIPGISSNAADNQNTNYSGAWWDTATFGPDCEAYVTLTVPGDYFGVFARVTDASGTPDGYKAGWNTDAGGTITLENMTGDVLLDSVSSGTGVPSAGDKIGIECIGTSIKVYIDAGGGWTQMLSVTNSAHTGAGAIGFDFFDSTLAKCDDFGGGDVVGGGTDYDADPNAASASAAGPLPNVTTVTRPYTLITIA